MSIDYSQRVHNGDSHQDTHTVPLCFERHTFHICYVLSGASSVKGRKDVRTGDNPSTSAICSGKLTTCGVLRGRPPAIYTVIKGATLAGSHHIAAVHE